MTDPQQTTRRIYEFFAEICRVPHPSFHCDEIRSYLKKTALTYKLEYRQDAAGNVRLDRRRADYSQAVALQSHMDMVGQSNDPDFDFNTCGIEFEEVNGFLQSKNRKTTLGADNGIGMAASLTAMTDPELKDVPLCAIFTVDEESGMSGALNIDPEFLDCKALFNLDSENWGDIIIGCAGGARLTVHLDQNVQDVPEDYTGIKVRIKGLKGGHSGVDIHLNRSNSILMMLDYISESCVKVTSFNGGTLSNAIPREAEFTGAVKDLKGLHDFTESYIRKVKKEFDVSDNFNIEISVLADPPKQCLENFGHTALYIKSAPYGAVAFEEDRGCVATSCNMAIINGSLNGIDMVLSVRSLFKVDLNNFIRDLANHFAKIGGVTNIKEGCPPWESTTSEEFLQTTSDIYRSLFNSECSIKYIHAGLECGLFQSKNSHIPIISFGPTILHPHSPDEQLDISTLKNFYKFLYAMVKNVLKK